MVDTDTMVLLPVESHLSPTLASPSRDMLTDMDTARDLLRLILTMAMVDTDTTVLLHLDFPPSPTLASPCRDMLRDMDTDGKGLENSVVSCYCLPESVNFQDIGMKVIINYVD